MYCKQIVIVLAQKFWDEAKQLIWFGNCLRQSRTFLFNPKTKRSKQNVLIWYAYYWNKSKTFWFGLLIIGSKAKQFDLLRKLSQQKRLPASVSGGVSDCFWCRPYCVGGPVVAFIPTVACIPAVVIGLDIAVILNVARVALLLLLVSLLLLASWLSRAFLLLLVLLAFLYSFRTCCCFTYWIVEWDVFLLTCLLLYILDCRMRRISLSGYQTMAIGLNFFMLSNCWNIEYRIGEFQKLSDYQILDSEKTIGCPSLGIDR